MFRNYVFLICLFSSSNGFAIEDKHSSDKQKINVSKVIARFLLRSVTLWKNNDSWKVKILKPGAKAHTRKTITGCGDDSSTFLGLKYEGQVNFKLSNNGDIIEVITEISGNQFGTEKELNSKVVPVRCPEHDGITCCQRTVPVDEDVYTKCENSFKSSEYTGWFSSGFRRDFKVT